MAFVQLARVVLRVHLDGFGEAEWPQLDPLPTPACGDAGVGRAERHRGRHLPGPVGQDQQQRCGHRVAQQVGDEPDGGDVGPVQVVQDEGQPVPGGQGEQPTGQLVGAEQPHVDRAGDTGQQRAVGFGPAAGVPPRVGTGWPGGAEGVPEDVERDALLGLHTGADDEGQGRRAAGQRGVHEAGLADSRVADHLADHLRSGAHAVDVSGADTRDLRPPSDEWWAGHHILQPGCHHADHVLSLRHSNGDRRDYTGA